jgi:hypothetical protein
MIKLMGGVRLRSFRSLGTTRCSGGRGRRWWLRSRHINNPSCFVRPSTVHTSLVRTSTYGVHTVHTVHRSYATQTHVDQKGVFLTSRDHGVSASAGEKRVNLEKYVRIYPIGARTILERGARCALITITIIAFPFIWTRMPIVSWFGVLDVLSTSSHPPSTRWTRLVHTHG